MSLLPYGLFELPWWGYVLVTFLTIESMFLGITLYLHRDQSHGGLILHPALRHAFRFWLWFSSAASPGSGWRCTAVTTRTRTSRAIRTVRWCSACGACCWRAIELYGLAAHDPHTLSTYGRGTPDDWLERRVYAAHPYAGITVFVILHLVLFGVPGIIMIAVHLAAQPFFAAGRHQRAGPRRRLPQLRDALHRDQPAALGAAAGRGGAAQQSSCLSPLGALCRAALGSSTSAGCGFGCSRGWDWRACAGSRRRRTSRVAACSMSRR